MSKILVTSIFFLIAQIGLGQKTTISGYVMDSINQELLPGALVVEKGTNNGVVTNKYGFFSLTTESATPNLIVSYLGYQNWEQTITSPQGQMNIQLSKSAQEIEEVVIDATEVDPVKSPQMSRIQVSVEDIVEIPALLGEKDVLKTLQLLPGVQSGSEGQSGFYVRGGGPDQNLIILDEAPVYNASHLFGYFSLFNGDALKSVDLIKGGFPARYGGRLSSVIDMQAKEGSKDHVTGQAKIGIISSSGIIEGPLSDKKNSSFILSGRRTYVDLITRPISKMQSEGRESGGYYFYDLIAKSNVDINEKNRLFLSGYFGRDRADFKYKKNGNSEKSKFGWGNATGTLRWNHVFSPKVFSNASLIFSHYDLTIGFEEDYDNLKYEFKYSSGIEDTGFKYDVDIFPNSKHFIKIGTQITRHLFEPSVRVERDDEFGINSKEVEDYVSLESAFYAEDEWFISDKLKTNLGLRLSYYREDEVDYIKPEPRVSLGYQINEDNSIKASYAEMNQYIHLLSNTGANLPTDLWVPSTDNVKPQFSRQYAFGLVHRIAQPELMLTIEGYYKTMDNIIAYKEGASFIDFEEFDDGVATTNWQNTITSGSGNSYGAELLVEKKVGQLHGWLGYTWSKTTHLFPDLNQGKEFPPKYDRRNDLSIVGIYDVKPNKLLSAIWVYGTGQAITLPVAEYQGSSGYYPFSNRDSYSNSYVVDYGTRNSQRMEAYHRLDISYQVKKERRKGTRAWEFGLYNVYNRKNPFFYYVAEDDSGDYKLKNVSIMHLVPTISWSFKFK